MFPSRKNASVTEGLMWAPELFEKRRAQARGKHEYGQIEGFEAVLRPMLLESAQDSQGLSGA
jgi:hypothetical protein